ncbi:MAG: hypothetical protein JEZ03_15475 [Bacteroidales bacterium]|nr:hypothetical protein [Bacteroidales bacterium]
MKNYELLPEDLPIYKKGKEIFEVVHQIGELIPADDEHLQYIYPILAS